MNHLCSLHNTSIAQGWYLLCTPSLMHVHCCHKLLLGFTLLLLSPLQLRAQKDTTLPQNKIDSFLSRQKGFLGGIAGALKADTNNEKPIQKEDKIFQKYANRTVRLILVQSLDFGISIGDTSKKINNSLTHLVNWLHISTKDRVIRNNLFFRNGDKLSPFVLANNERYLRNLPYIQDASIVVRPVPNHPDSVDITVFVKDVFSIGGSLRPHSYQSLSASVQDDNTMGWGDRLQLQTLFDRQRRPALGFGAAYVKRNLGGSFVDLGAGYLNFSPAFNSGRKEENTAFVNMEKPLVNPYSVWTWSASVELHSTSNMFGLDSVFNSQLKYKYRLYDGWIGRNLTANPVSSDKEFSRLRFLLSLRLIDQKFLEKPSRFMNGYTYSFANTFAVLAALSAYKQRFYKTSYIYGFGRHEDLPAGVNASFVSGFTQKEGRARLYSALNLGYNYVTARQRFLSYAIAAGSSFYKGTPEDVALLASADYFGPLHQWNRWKQRIFVNASVAKQLNPVMDEPLFLESSYGLPGYNNELQPGWFRGSVKMESVFFSPLSVLYFRFAPFVFGNLAWFKGLQLQTVPIVGGGLRCRNESLVFGTIELKGSYFLKEDNSRTRYSLSIRTNLRYRYNQDFIKKPSFIQVN